LTKSNELAQKELCKRYGAPYWPSPDFLKVGIALNVRNGLQPINGLRHPVTKDTTGWYIWAGHDLSPGPDFFKPLHVEHLAEWCPIALRYLGLPPGWRFLVAPDHEDVWFDASLLNRDESLRD
jgi:hypothetical protein